MLAAIVCAGCAQFDRVLGVFTSDPSEYFDDARVVELLDAASRGNLDEVRGLVDSGVDIEARSNDHDPKRTDITPLLWAVEYESAQTVRTLIEAGADPRDVTVSGYNAVNYAVLRDNIITLTALLDADPSLIDSPDRFGGNAVHGIALYDREEMLDLMVERGVDLDTQQTVSGQTPLFSAAAVNNVDLCLTLVKAGADAGVRNRSGKMFLESLFDTNDKVMNSKFLSDREKLIDELRERGFPVETGR